MKLNNDVFLRQPTDDGSLQLHKGIIKNLLEQSVVVEFDLPEHEFAEGDDVLLYFDSEGRFNRQAANITKLRLEENKLECCFTLRGTAASAESRDYFRIISRYDSIHAEVGDETECPVLDVSAGGLGVVARTERKVGDMVRLRLCYRGETVTGMVRVQSVRDEGGDGFRYGLHYGNDQPNDPMHQTLTRITMDLQRRQLARLAGNG